MGEAAVFKKGLGKDELSRASSGHDPLFVGYVLFSNLLKRVKTLEMVVLQGCVCVHPCQAS